MAKIVIDRETCKGCLLCISFCPKGLIVIDSKFNKRGLKPAKFKQDKECLGCKVCTLVCPEACIEVYK